MTLILTFVVSGTENREYQEQTRNMWTWERTHRDSDEFRSATKGEFRGWYRNLAFPQVSVAVILNLFIVYQLSGKLENADEDLKEERRRHEETRNQLETTKRQLEAAEKVKLFVMWLEHTEDLEGFVSYSSVMLPHAELFILEMISTNVNLYWLYWHSTKYSGYSYTQKL